MGNKLLVLATDYPTADGYFGSMFIHVRNQYYRAAGLDVTVLNFSASADYVLDGVPVCCPASFAADPCKADILVCHAANLRNHYRFLKKYGTRFPRFVFFFHGHEIRRIGKDYPKPYEFVGQNAAKKWVQSGYDALKLAVWRRYYPSVAAKSEFVFVSQSLADEFIRNVRPKALPAERLRVIHNSVGKVFEEQSYQPNAEKKYDCVTVRSNLDNSTYCIDLICRMAKANPELRFLTVGKGSYFLKNPPPENLEYREGPVPHEQLPALLNTARCALMPTRLDAQGVMSCELATFGIPLITSDLPVCREIFSDFKNAELIDNRDPEQPLSPVIDRLWAGVPYEKSHRYFYENTVAKEIALFRSLL